MSVKAEVDIAKLERSIKKYAKAFGESSAQAVTRWSVQTCRELAKYSQPFGSGKGRNRGSIRKDASRCLIPVASSSAKGRTALKTVQEVLDWIDKNRTLEGKRVPKLPISQRRRCSRVNYNKAIKIKTIKAGMVKGGWIGAGNEIAKNQTGSDKFSVGSNFLKYAQAHNALGDAKPPISGFKPVASITNNVKYSGNDYVLRTSQIKKAIADGRRKCLTFYRIVVNKLNKK